MFYISPYKRNLAVDYAKKWAMKRNPRYLDFENLGGDCTNFISQCIYAGSGIMNYTPVFGWYYISSYKRSPSWTGVQYLYNFLVNNKAVGPFAKEVDISKIQLGDIIQLGKEDGSFYHSLIVTAIKGEPSLNTILVSAHTYDVNLVPLSSYYIVKMRCLHIEGVRHG